MVTRSEESRQAVLDAAFRLVNPDSGTGLTIKNLTIEAIAKEAGVSKATIYRWWDSKADVVLEAFLADYLPVAYVPQDRPFSEAMKLHVRSIAKQYAGLDGALVAQMIAEGQFEPAALARFKERFWNDRREAAVALISRGQREGSVRTDLDPQLVATLIYAPLYHRLLLRDGPLDDQFADNMLTMALTGIAPKSGT